MEFLDGVNLQRALIRDLLFPNGRTQFKLARAKVTFCGGVFPWLVKGGYLGSWLRMTGNDYRDLSSSFLNIDLILYNFKSASQIKKSVSQERLCLFLRKRPEKNSDFPRSCRMPVSWAVTAVTEVGSSIERDAFHILNSC